MSEKIRLRLGEDASFGFGCGALRFEQRAIGFSAADIVRPAKSTTIATVSRTDNVFNILFI